ncbi:MAG: hypothetical protein AAFR04_14420 [Pseudomonadota bacterium]
MQRWLALISFMAASALPVSVGMACDKAAFERVVQQSSRALQGLTQANKPRFQRKLQALKAKRGWSYDEFLTQAAPFVHDPKTQAYDQSTQQTLARVYDLGREGTREVPDCKVLDELRGLLERLVTTQKAKWRYLFTKVDAELAR